MLILQIMIALVIIVVTIAASVKLNENEFGENGVGVRAFPAAIGAIVLFVWIFAIMPAFGQVPTGHTGVVLSFGGVTGETKSEGLYVVKPFVENVILMNTQKQTYQAKDVDAASKDLQSVRSNVDLLFSLDPSRVTEIYRSLGQDYVSRVILPSVEEVMKANTSGYEAERLITNRLAVKSGIDNDLETRLAPYGIRVEQVNITNFSFSKEFEQSIEAKVVAEQLGLKAENDLKRIRTEAEQKIATAQAEAESIRLQGQALRDSPDLVQLRAVERWDGKMPQYMTGNSVPFISIPVTK